MNNEFNVSLEILGKRLSEFREELNLKQREIAEKINVGQETISRVESGGGIHLVLFVNLINYYGKYFYIDSLFLKDFKVLRLDPDSNKKNKLISQIKVLQKEYSSKFNDIISQL